MNLLQLILKQMRQRLLSTCLTCLSILLGMTLATSILIMSRESRALFTQSDYGYELLVGPKGSDLPLVLNAVYHIGDAKGVIPYRLYEDIAISRSISDGEKPSQFQGMAAWAIPYAVGDSYKGRHIVGTVPQLFGVDDEGKPLRGDKVPVYRADTPYTFAQGRAFAPAKFEAVIGSDTAATLRLKLGDTIQATHGVPTATVVPTDQHPEKWTIVGILNETHTASDKVLFIPLISNYAIFEHEEGLEKINDIKEGTHKSAGTASATQQKSKEAYTLNSDGTINLKLPKEEWAISAILVHTRSAGAFFDMKFRLGNLAEADAISPAKVMGDFFDQYVPKVQLVFMVISALVTIVAGVSILVSIYNSVMARQREIAIMRALGATKERILAAVCLEAALIGALGGIVGLVAGHAVAAAGSLYLQRTMGAGIAWWRPGPWELVYLCVVILVSLLAGLVPAMKAYQVPVAENLVGS